MGRKPKIIIDQTTGDASMRVQIPRAVFLLAEHLRDEHGFAAADYALTLILKAIGAALADPQRGDQAARMLLGPLFAESLRRVRKDNFGALGTGPVIDLDKLHRSTKTKSGFHGVYTNGKGFRAIGRVPGSTAQKHIGTYDSAEEAAWHRFLYYYDHDLPYGEWEDHIDRLRAQGTQGSDADLCRIAEQINIDSGVSHLNSAPGRPRKPSTAPVGFAFDQIAQNARSEADDDDPVAELEAANDARDAAQRRAHES